MIENPLSRQGEELVLTMTTRAKLPNFNMRLQIIAPLDLKVMTDPR